MQSPKNRSLFTLSAIGLAVSLATANADNRDLEEAQEEAREARQEISQETREARQEITEESREAGQEYSGSARNAWIHGKLETAYLLNGHLNNFAINSRVVGETAYLTGTVESDIDKDLAEEVAMNIKGITKVENDLQVDAERARTERDDDDMDEQGRSFAQRIEDATTTAVVKSKLLANDATGGFDINVDTRNDVVTLRGNVESSEEKALAQEVANNTEDVKSVVNELVIKEES